MSNLGGSIAAVAFKLWLCDVLNDTDLREILKKLGYLK